MRHCILATAVALGFTTAASATIYPGNGANGFGGTVGMGAVEVTDTAASMSVSGIRGPGQWNDVLTLFLDTQPGGVNDTSMLTDTADGGRRAISGTDGVNRTLLSFPAGFGADYAINIENGFIGVFQIVENGSHNFLFGAPQSGNNMDVSYTLMMSAAEMAQIGLTAGSGQTFNFAGSYISGSAYRSNETIGPSNTVPGDGAGNAGFNNPQEILQTFSYTLVPEPASLGFVAMAGICLLARRRGLR